MNSTERRTEIYLVWRSRSLGATCVVACLTFLLGLLCAFEVCAQTVQESTRPFPLRMSGGGSNDLWLSIADLAVEHANGVEITAHLPSQMDKRFEFLCSTNITEWDTALIASLYSTNCEFAREYTVDVDRVYYCLRVCPGTNQPVWGTDSALTFSSSEPGVVDLQWEAAGSSYGISGYGIYQDGVLIAEVASTVVTYRVSGLATGCVYSLLVVATNSNADWSEVSLCGAVNTLPPVPDVQGDLPDVGVVSLISRTARFIYTGTNAIQTGVDTNVLDETRVSVLHGRVVNVDGNALFGVGVSVNNSPEYGCTLSRTNGRFDLVVNGGEPLVLNFQKTDWLAAQRTLMVYPSQDVVVPEVRMVVADTNTTHLDLSTNTEMLVARGGTVTDGSGTRTAAVMFPTGLVASIIAPDGSTQQVDNLTTRFTEYSVTTNGAAAMPGDLPATVAYTYCIEMGSDEAQIKQNGRDVLFSEPVYFYVDNFLDMPTGTAVPVGYYDQDKARWVPTDNGLVIQLLGTNALGLVEVDIDGDGYADDTNDLAAIGFTDEERLNLAVTYNTTQSLWRAAMEHFSTYDLNYGALPEPGAEYPDIELSELESSSESIEDSVLEPGYGEVAIENRAFRERAPVVGTPYRLHYSSRRMADRIWSIEIPLTDEEVPVPLKRVELEIDVAGALFTTNFPATPNQSYEFKWDRLDALGRELLGGQPATIRVSYVYDGYYAMPTPSSTSFGEASGALIPGDIPTRAEIYLSQCATLDLGGFDPRALRTGGWTLNIHHVYDPVAGVLYRGDGTARGDGFKGKRKELATIAGTGVAGSGGDEGKAISANLNHPHDVAAAPSGEFYIADTDNHRVRKVDTNGIITTVAGTGEAGYSGDNGSAGSAKLHTPMGLSLGMDGTLYISDTSNHCVRKVSPKGVIKTVAGSATAGFSGDGGPATSATLDTPRGIDIAADGTLYIADFENHRVRRVSPSGVISTCAGNGLPFNDGDGGAATNAGVAFPVDVELSDFGILYVADPIPFDVRLRRVTPDGIIDSTYVNPTAESGTLDAVAVGRCSIYLAESYFDIESTSNGWSVVRDIGGRRIVGGGADDVGYNGDDLAADETWLNNPRGLDASAVGLYIADTDNNRIRILYSGQARFSGEDIYIPSKDGSELYQFSPAGRHLYTYDTLSGETIYTFVYEDGLLIQIIDGDDNLCEIERDAQGEAETVVGWYGQETALTVDGAGWLTSVENPGNESMSYKYSSQGLLTNVITRRGYEYTCAYDNDGSLDSVRDPSGGGLTLNKGAGDWQVIATTAEGHASTYVVERINNGNTQRRTITDPVGLIYTRQETLGADIFETYPDGTTVSTTRGPDPRFGMDAPVVTRIVAKTPGGLTNCIDIQHSASLSNANDPLSLQSLTTVVTTDGRTNTSTHTTSNRTTVSTSPMGKQTTVQLDDMSRPVSLCLPELHTVNYTYDGDGRISRIQQQDRITTLAYDGNGHLSAVSNALGYSTSLQADSVGRLTNSVRPDGFGVSAAYNRSSRPIALILPQGEIHCFTGTPVNLGARYTPPDAIPGDNSTYYTWNPERKLVGVTLPNGVTVTNQFDSAGRLHLTREIGGFGISVTSTYNTVGHLESLATGDQNLNYEYDGGLLTNLIYAGLITGEIAFAYNNDFRTTVISCGNTNVSYTYDNDGMLIQAGELQLSRSAASGFLTNIVLGGVSNSMRYNGYGEITEYRVAATSNLLVTSYQYDNVGHITNKHEIILGATNNYAYTYNCIGRLTAVVGFGGESGTYTNTYQYDSNGNRTNTSLVGAISTATYDAQDRLVQYGTNSYTFDGAGSLLTVSNSVAVTHYQYDSFGNLHSVSAGATVIEYLHDGQHRRIGKKVNGTRTQGFLYKDQINPVAELDGSNNVVSVFVYGTRPHVPDYIVKTGITYRLVTDHLGSVRLVVNSDTGTIAQRIDYDEFGRILQDTNPGFQPFGFAGGLYDPDTGLTRFGFRDYDPATGRWTAKDPILFAGGQANLYLYCHGDSVNYLDPLGLGDDWARDAGRVVDNAIIDSSLWQGLTGHAGDNIDFNKRYIDTQKLGTIDLRHVTSAAVGPPGSATLGGFFVETVQLLCDPDSAFKQEDLVSNVLGGVAGDKAAEINISTGQAVETIIRNAEPVGPPYARWEH